MSRMRPTIHSSSTNSYGWYGPARPPPNPRQSSHNTGLVDSSLLPTHKLDNGRREYRHGAFPQATRPYAEDYSLHRESLGRHEPSDTSPQPYRREYYSSPRLNDSLRKKHYQEDPLSSKSQSISSNRFETANSNNLEESQGDRGVYKLGRQRPISDNNTADHYLSDSGQVEDIQQDKPPTQPEDQGIWTWNSLKKTVWGESNTTAKNSDENQASDGQTEQGGQDYHNTLWGRLANVGSSIQKKINGDEGYASDASDYEGESHLIRIMKRYHTEKAESKDDLPDWLFSEAELNAINIENVGRKNIDRSERNQERRQEQNRPSGLKDSFDSVNFQRSSSPRTKQSFDSGYGSSASSLKSREARYRFVEDEHVRRTHFGRNRLNDYPGGTGAHQHVMMKNLHNPHSPNRYMYD
ncbi:hypothetical protein O181_050091 [Austropuccinia psidii MF-1]|uniref:Uncharacterized protein n=1 Tax=Austropuccinia psidii MF-1 TaxID=1389203 RepID=A0A9Q3DTM9_9BASI|nr:hypothetical protein [Austropuccinia psidii MF-1]